MSDGGGNDKTVRAVTTATFARIHSVSVFTVRRWIEEGKVQAVKCPSGFRWRVIVEKNTEQTVADEGELK